MKVRGCQKGKAEKSYRIFPFLHPQQDFELQPYTAAERVHISPHFLKTSGERIILFLKKSMHGKGGWISNLKNGRHLPKKRCPRKLEKKISQQLLLSKKRWFILDLYSISATKPIAGLGAVVAILLLHVFVVVVVIGLLQLELPRHLIEFGQFIRAIICFFACCDVIFNGYGMIFTFYLLRMKRKNKEHLYEIRFVDNSIVTSCVKFDIPVPSTFRKSVQKRSFSGIFFFISHHPAPPVPRGAAVRPRVLPRDAPGESQLAAAPHHPVVPAAAEPALALCLTAGTQPRR